MNRKAAFSLLLAVMLVLCLAACEGDPDKLVTPTVIEEPAANVTNADATATDTPQEQTSATPTETTKTNAAAPKEAKSAEVTALSAAPLTVEVGKSAALTVSITPADAANRSLTYSSSNAAVAAVSASGNVSGVKAGSATITITAANGVTATVAVTVKSAKTVEVTALSAAPITVEVGKSMVLTIGVTPANAANVSLTYSSSDPSVASVSANGIVTGVKIGSASITITAANGISTTAAVTVTQAQIQATSMTVFPNTMTLYVGESSTFRVTLTPANATTAVSYSSGDPSVAVIDSAGNISAVAVGTVTITISSDNGMVFSLPVTVLTKESTTGAAGTFDYDWCQQVLTLVNQERTAAGLAELSYQSSRQELADTRAIEIVSDFSHNGFRNANGENIAAGQASPQEVVTAWMNSPGHRANILRSDFTSIVVSCYNQGGRYYWVQLFFI